MDVIRNVIGDVIRPVIGVPNLRAATYVKTDRALDLGKLAPFTVPDLSGNDNTATQYTGIYVDSNGSTDILLGGVDLTAAGTITNVTINVKAAVGVTIRITGGAGEDYTATQTVDGGWEEHSITTSGTFDNFRVGCNHAETLFTLASWSDIRVSTAISRQVARWKLYDSADASLDGYPALDCVGGYHGAHVGCAGGSAEVTILQTAGEDFNNRMWFDGVDDNVQISAIAGTTNATITGKVLLAPGETQGTLFSDTTLSSRFIGGINSGSALSPYNGAGTPVTKVDGVTVATREALYQALSDNQPHTVTIIGADISAWSNITFMWFEATASFRTNGLMWDVTIDNTTSGSIDHSYLGNGNTDAAWEDQVGGNDGTVNGSPSLYHVAESCTTRGEDALGNAIENPRPNSRVWNLSTGTGYGEIADSASLDLTTAATWEIWFNPFGAVATDEQILAKDDGSTGYAFELYKNAGDPADEIIIGISRIGTTGTIYAATISGLTDSVGQLVITFDSSTGYTAYFNSSSLTATPAGTLGAMNASVANLLIGKSARSRANCQRQLGDIRIYDRALTADEVLQNYNARKGAYGI